MEYNISIIGTGYVGMVTGACFAECGLNVLCMDNDNIKINDLKNMKIPIYEPGLEEIVRRNVEAGRLRFTTNLNEVVKFAKTIFIAVGTPSKDDGSADLQYVFSVAKELTKHMNSYRLIVNKSTVPVGTAKEVQKIIQTELINLGKEVEFDVASNPEFLREGAAVKDFMCPDRIVIGTYNKRSEQLLKKIYYFCCKINSSFVFTTPETSELTKYASNAFLATKISFINEIANICEEVNADVNHVAIAMGMDNRIGKSFLHPGPGFGGSCFPKDIKALANTGRKYGHKMEIVEAVINVNQLQRKRVIKKISKILKVVKGKSIAILGIAFKPETDDIRESPSIYLIKELYKKGAQIKVFDPVAMENMKSIHNDFNILYCKDEYEACEGTDAIVFMTEWDQFRSMDFNIVKEKMRNHVIFDFRNIYDPEKLKKYGFIYEGIGRL